MNHEENKYLHMAYLILWHAMANIVGENWTLISPEKNSSRPIQKKDPNSNN